MALKPLLDNAPFIGGMFTHAGTPDVRCYKDTGITLTTTWYAIEQRTKVTVVGRKIN